MALQKATSRGVIAHLSRGLYHYPRKHPKLGTLAPTPEQIAQALAGRDSLRLQPSGAYAANLLGLTEQVPAKVIFLTDCTNRRVQVGNQEIILQKTTPKNMAPADRISGLVIQALRYVGQDAVDDTTVSRLAHRLSADQRRDLLKDIRYAPAWIGDIMRRLAEMNT